VHAKDDNAISTINAKKKYFFIGTFLFGLPVDGFQ
jgi:hypothetical protein